MDENEIERLAREEILKETRRAAERADQVGPQGWMKCPIPVANKRFLRNTLMQAIRPTSSKIRRQKTDSDEVAEKKLKTVKDTSTGDIDRNLRKRA